MVHQPDPLVGKRLDGRYDITAYLASGSYGAVYRARQVPLGREVAVKVVHRFAPAQHAQRLQREARLLASLDHPNVVPIHDGGRLPDGRPYLVESFIEGATLRHLLYHTGPLPPGRAVSIAAQLLDGLDAVHALGVTHRDVKPTNVMLSSRGGVERARLIDFGVARTADESDAFATLTATGGLVGSPNYMSPEQIRGQAVGPPTDVYAVGVVLYEMLTGRQPFEADSIVAALQAHLTAPVPALPPTVPAPLAAVVTRALAKAPADRYPTAAAMSAALAETSGQRLGLDDRYVIEHVLGAGGFGEVLLARHRALDREVAIKIGTVEGEDARARFVREAQIMADLHHPGLATLREFGTLPDGRPFMVQDRVLGHALDAVLAAQGPIEPARAVQLMLGVLAPLEAAHAAGVVHRDLKPANVMVEAGDRVVLIDFGLARSADADDEALTTLGLFVGTVGYGAPEQGFGGEISARTDVYAAGVLLYEMLTGERPFAGADPVAVLVAHRDEPLPPLPAHVPRRVQQVIERACAKAPADRFASAGEMAAALEEIEASPRRRWLAPVAAVVVCVLLAGIAALAWPDETTPVVEEPEVAERIRIGKPTVLSLKGYIERSLARCDCAMAAGDLDDLHTLDPEAAVPLRARWQAACDGPAPSCAAGE